MKKRLGRIGLHGGREIASLRRGRRKKSSRPEKDRFRRKNIGTPSLKSPLSSTCRNSYLTVRRKK